MALLCVDRAVTRCFLSSAPALHCLARSNGEGRKVVGLCRRECGLWGSSVEIFPPPRTQQIAWARPVATPLASSQLADFADQETSKFRDGLLAQLESAEELSDAKVKIADVCAKVFRDFVAGYEGTLSIEPFGKMRTALEGEGLPGVDKAVLAALGWARGHLHYDWELWTSK